MHVSTIARLPLRSAALAIQATTTFMRVTADGAGAAAAAVGTIASAGVEVAAVPVRQSAEMLAGDTSLSTLTRRCWRGDGRAWLEVRGLNESDGSERGRAVTEALQGLRGVAAGRVHRPLSRVVV